MDTLACVFVAYAPYQYLRFASILNELRFAVEELSIVNVDEVVLLAFKYR